MAASSILIAGVNSGSGKTTVTLGLLRALRQRGLRVQAYKVGPDYIDPGLHQRATGKPSHNLDSWMGDERLVAAIHTKYTSHADVAVIEGVMGLFDGSRMDNGRGSTADVAKILQCPVVLVVNVRGMGQSVIALIKGFIDYDKKINVLGVILNNASGSFYEDYIKQSIEAELGIIVFGCFSKQANLEMPERHLGLLPAEENPGIDKLLLELARKTELEIDIDKLLEVTAADHNTHVIEDRTENEIQKNEQFTGVTIAVARDKAFSFYYEDNLNYLQELGAKIVEFSPISDQKLPTADGIILGGGFPELYLKELNDNSDMLLQVKAACENGMPLYAECGGYMYLAQKILDFDKCEWSGSGVLPVTIEMQKKRVALGYVVARANVDSIVASVGDVIRGHEFHYSKAVELVSNSQPAYSLVSSRSTNITEPHFSGWVKGNVCASYLHVHFRSNPLLARNFLRACVRGKRR